MFNRAPLSSRDRASGIVVSSSARNLRHGMVQDARIAKNTAKPEPVERALSLPVNSFEKQGLAHVSASLLLPQSHASACSLPFLSLSTDNCVPLSVAARIVCISLCTRPSGWSRWARANWFAIQETTRSASGFALVLHTAPPRPDVERGGTRRHGWRVSPAPSATTLRSGSGESEVNQSPLFNTVQMAMHVASTLRTLLFSTPGAGRADRGPASARIRCCGEGRKDSWWQLLLRHRMRGMLDTESESQAGG
eukprot:2578363-Rhodomonas_salina.2